MAHTVETGTERYSGSYEKDPQGSVKGEEDSKDGSDALQDVESQKVAGSETPASRLETASRDDESSAGIWGWLAVCGASVI